MTGGISPEGAAPSASSASSGPSGTGAASGQETDPPSCSRGVFSPEADAKNVERLFSGIAGVYDLLNRVLSFGLDSLWRTRLANAVIPFPPKGTARVLDLAAGTLDVSVALAKRYPQRSVLALDYCRPMLVKGLPKLAGLKNKKVYPLVGDGRRLPLPDGSVDAVTIAFGLRNIRPREEAYAEVLRVLVPGGRFCVLEFGSAQDRILFGLYNFYLSKVLPRVGQLLSRDKAAYQYLADTIAAYPSAGALAEEMRAAGFTGVRHESYTAGIVRLHIGKKAV